MSISHTPDSPDAPRPPPSRLRRAGAWLRRAAVATLGTYTPPPWTKWATTGVVKHRGRVGLAVLAFSAVGVLAFAVKQFIESRPKPDVAVVTVVPPSPPSEPSEGAAPAPPDPLVLRFDRSVAPIEKVGKTVDADVEMSPTLAGTWTWSTDSELAFVPAARWPVGGSFEVELKGTLLAPHVLLEERTYSFRTSALEARIAEARFDEDVRDPRVHRVVATLQFNYPVDVSTVRAATKLGRIDERGAAVEYEIELSSSAYRAFVRSANIPIPLRDGSVELSVGKGVTSPWGGEPLASTVQAVVSVPGQYTFFRVAQGQLGFVQNERHEPERVLFLRFTGGVDEAELDRNVEAYMLPRDRPAEPGTGAELGFLWSSSEQVTSKVLAQATKLKLERTPVESPDRTFHAYRVDAPPNRHLYWRVKAGAKSRGGFVLADHHAAVEVLAAPPRTLEFMSGGAVLSMAGEKKVPLVSRGVAVIDARVARFLPGTLHHLLSQSAGRFEDPRFLNHRFSEHNLATILHERIPAAAPGDTKTAYSSLDLGPLFEGARRGLFLVDVREHVDTPTGKANDERFDATEVGGDHATPCEGCDEYDNDQGEYDDGAGGYDEGERIPGMTGKATDRRLLLLTDLGILLKRAVDGSFDVFVQDLGKGTPVAGAHVYVLGLNGTSVHDVSTGADGRASFPKLTNLPPEREPVAVVVEKDDDMSFLPWGRRDRVVATSRFDVGGAVSLSARGLEATLFSDRGLYRPGETMHVAGIVKNGGWSKPVDGVPLELALTSPSGTEVSKVRIKLKANGFFEHTFTTRDVSPTGTYQATLFTVKDNFRQAQLADTPLRVEEFEPDRMRIRAALSETRVEGWVHPSSLTGLVHMENLFGVPAESRSVEASIDLHSTAPSFTRYADYSFSDAPDERRHLSESLGALVTNKDGDVSFDLGLDRFAAGMYRLAFTAEGHDVGGGRAVVARTAAYVSPLASLVGSKADGPTSLIPVKLARQLTFIAIDSKLDMIARPDLHVELVEQKYVSTLIRRDDGTYAYQSRLREIVRGSKPLSISAKGTSFALDTSAPGDFMIVVRDKDGADLHRTSYSVSGVNELSGNLEKNAELDVKLDRSDYRTGDPVRVRVIAPYVGAGLITIERERVFAAKWFKAGSASFEETIDVPGGLEGNAYVHVTYLRDLAAPEVFTSPLSTGIVPFSISRAERTLALDVKAPARVQPGDTFKVRVTSDRPADVVVFGVDEGILQLARYQAPDPLSFFLRKRALQVETSEILDLLLPEYSVFRAALAAGGDGDGALGKNLNPFKRKTDKPAVFWSGIVSVDDKGKDLSFSVPATFDGNLKIMAVAVNEGAIGKAATEMLVRGHFVLSPSAPLFLAPGDETVVTVGVTNLVDGSGKALSVKLEAKATGSLEIVEAPSAALTIDEGREQVVRLKVRAKHDPGAGAIELVASARGKSSKRSIELSIRPASPYQVVVQAGAVKGGAKDVALKRTMFPEFRTLEASVSTLPLGMAKGLNAYLSTYPYGCTEQVLSRTAPSLVARTQPELSAHGAADQAEVWSNALMVLAARQTSSGAIGLWSELGETPPFVTLYAMHMLVDGADKGLSVPKPLLARMTRYVEARLRPDAVEPLPPRLAAYALYLLARQGQARGPDMERLARELTEHQGETWRKDLTGIYLAAAWKIAKSDERARELLGGAKLFDDVIPDPENFYDGNVRDAQLLYLLAKHFPEAIRYVDPHDLSALVTKIAERQLTSLTASYAILALDAYATAVTNADASTLSVAEKAKGKSAALALRGSLLKTTTFSDDAEALTIEAQGAAAGFFSVVEAGFDRAPPTERTAQGLEVVHEILGPNGGVITSVALGDVVDIRVRLRSLSAGMERVAIVDLLPAGFSVEMDRAIDAGNGADRLRARGTLTADSVDVREDRVVLYARAGREMLEYVYRARAIAPGRFQVPSAFAQGMYDPMLVARSAASTIEVK